MNRQGVSLTQAGLNTARDVSPRIFAAVTGWGSAALPDSSFGFITIYVLGPLCGAVLATFIFAFVIEPMVKGKKANQDSCCCS